MNLQKTKILRMLSKGILVLTGLFLLGFLGWTVYRGIKFRPYKVRVTNVTDSAFTVSWVTDSPMPGIVYYGEKDTFLPGPLAWLGKEKAVDDRDFSNTQGECISKFNEEASKNKDENFTIDASGFDCNDVKVWKYGKYFTHHVTVQNLDAEKEYFFRVGDGVLSYSKGKTDGVVYVEREIPEIDSFKQKTLPVITKVEAPNPAYGTSYNIYYRDDGTMGEKKNFDSLIFLKTFKEGKSIPTMSSVCNSDGGWSIDLSNLRDEKGEPIGIDGTALEFIPQSENSTPGATGTSLYEDTDFPLNLVANGEEFWNENSNKERANQDSEIINQVLGVFTFVAKAAPINNLKIGTGSAGWGATCNHPNGCTCPNSVWVDDGVPCPQAPASKSYSLKCYNKKSCTLKTLTVTSPNTTCEKLTGLVTSQSSCDAAQLPKEDPANKTCYNGWGGKYSVAKEVVRGGCSGSMASCYVKYVSNGQLCGYLPASGLECGSVYCGDTPPKELNDCDTNCNSLGGCICPSGCRTTGTVVKGKTCGGDPKEGWDDLVDCFQYSDACKKMPNQVKRSQCSFSNQATCLKILADTIDYSNGEKCYQIDPKSNSCKFHSEREKGKLCPVGTYDTFNKCDAEIEKNYGSNCYYINYKESGEPENCGSSKRVTGMTCSAQGLYSTLDGCEAVLKQKARSWSDSQCYAVKVSGSTRSCVKTNCEESTAFQSYQNCNNSLAANGNECYWFSPSSNKCYKIDCAVRSDYREPTCGGREGFWEFDPNNTQKSCYQIPWNKYTGTYYISNTFDNCEYRRKLTNDTKATAASSITAIQVNKPTNTEKPISLQKMSNGGQLGICNGRIQPKSEDCAGNAWQNPQDIKNIENLPKIINCLDTKTGEVSSYQVGNSLYTSCPGDKEKQLDAVTLWNNNFQKVDDYYCCSIATPAPGSTFIPSTPQKTCDTKNIVSWNNCFHMDMGNPNSSLTKQFVGQIFANEVVNDKGNGIFYFPNSGMFELETQNNLKMELLVNQKTPYFFYIERNGVSGYQPPKNEQKIELSEDLIYSETGFVISLSQTASTQNISLKQGINIISFNFHPSQGKESKNLTSSDFLLLANAVDRNISRISYFAAGQWNGGTSYDFENNETKGVPFDLVFGKGYVVVAEQDCTISIPGYNIESPVPIAFSSGWNLVGVHGQKEAYTAKTFIESINTIEGLKANNVSWWPTSRGMYQGYQLQNGQEYGQDFPISPINGYFVRIAEFTPKEDTCKSLIWNPSGEMNGECGSNN